MRVHLGAGWHLHHITDRVVELRKDDYAYRQFTGRDGFVRVRAEPGMDRNAMIEKAREEAQKNDADLADRIGKQLVPQRLGRYQARQRELAPVFSTPEDPERIGRKRA